MTRAVLLSFVAVLWAAAVSSACAADDDPSAPAPSSPAEDMPPAARPDEPGEPAEAGEHAAVAHERELRGAWISTVYNGTWPSKTGLSPAAAQAELVGIFDALAAANMNAVFLQVRPESDAVYASSIEPWSRFLTGTQGKAPGWDPLAFAVVEAHRRGLELHAWLNPYRGLVSSAIAVADTHVTKTLAPHAVVYGNQIWMDPGAPLVRAHILDVIRDLLARYDVDGIHFDDYFYPYPIAGTGFDDDASYAAYTGAGGTLAKDDWRRSNVDTLVRDAGALIAKERPDVRFGISPFGIYRPGTPSGVTGLDAYAALYCDPVKWMAEGWVDYLAPQLYWPTTSTGQPFAKLIAWWAGLASDGRSIFVGHDATKVGAAGWPLAEYDAQMKLARAERPRGVRGSIFFSAKPLVADELGLRTALATDPWAKPAATPRLALAPAGTPEPPVVARAAGSITVAPGGGGPVRAVAIYREGALVRLVPAAAPPAPTAVELPPGRSIVSVIDRAGRESAGTVVDVE